MTIPDSVEAFGEDMSLVYEWCVNRILINIARRFPYIVDEEARGGFEWQAAKLAEFGQVNEENMAIIRQGLSGVPEFLRDGLEREIIAAIERVEPDLKKAAEQGLLPGTPPPMSGAVQRELDAYYRQAADKMNLVNTVMLDSTQQAYKDIVSDITAKTAQTQRILDQGAGSVITGVESLNSATRQAVSRMLDNGLTGFIDHAGHRWRPEAYAMMDIRTTTMNAARQAAFDRCDDFGSDIIQVDSHAGARPLCYPWQGKLISRTDFSRDVEDLYGTKVHVYALSETSYGQPAGLFGINCRHFGTPFIPGFSGLGNKNLIQDKKENDERYQLTQEQRGMERAIRDARLRASVAKVRGDEEEEKKWREKAKALSDRIGDFCEEHGLPRRKEREYTPVNAKWPAGREKGPFPYNVQSYQGNGKVTPTTYTYQQATKSVENITVKTGEWTAPAYKGKADVYTLPDGVSFAFKQNMDTAHQAMTPEFAIEQWYRVPEELRKQAQNRINIVDVYNPADEYWRKMYKNFPHSYAIGGDEISFFRYDYQHNANYVVRTYSHEIAHYIDKSMGANGTRYSASSDWLKAMQMDLAVSGKNSITDYGENSTTEDFAESIAEYVMNPQMFSTTMPNRSRIIESIMRRGRLML